MAKFSPILRILVRIHQGVVAVGEEVRLLRLNQQAVPKPPDDEPWLYDKDVTDILKISHSTLKRWRQQGVIPSTRIGRTHFYKMSQVYKALHDNHSK